MPRIEGAEQVYKIAKEDKRFETKFILLETEKDELIKRYALSRHVHPRSILQKMSLGKAIELDVKDAEELTKYADYEINTTQLTIKELRHRMTGQKCSRSDRQRRQTGQCRSG